MRRLWVILVISFLLAGPVLAESPDYHAAGTSDYTVTLANGTPVFVFAVKAYDADIWVVTRRDAVSIDSFVVEAGDAVTIPAWVDQIRIKRTGSTAVMLAWGFPTMKGPEPDLGAGGETAINSLVTASAATTDSYGVLPSSGRVEVVINESADDIAYGTPKLYAIGMAGYSRLTIKCVHDGSATESIPTIAALLSSTSDITLATGNPVWFNNTPTDSTITGWILASNPTSDIGAAIPITDTYGNWATSDYIIIKVTASTETSDGIQDFKLIAIKEQ